ncbi:MAG: GTPase HflX [Rhodospirillales bacterium]|nr:GTPase HflX [Rhodospirillales bacterium]
MLHPDVRSLRAERRRDASARLDEAVGLAAAIDLDIRFAEVVNVAQIRPATFFGSGAVDRLKEAIEEHEILVVAVDTALSPAQQQNLERAWKCKVIDRTGLILEIFGARARTREGVLQVELAALSYQRSRLVRAWTHLERQRGGAGFLGGPGESQIESDRRAIDDRILSLKRDLTEVRRTRDLHRKARKRESTPTIALVGYTNAGKSTLFNRLTEAEVVARDQLFATLDPTMRGFTLPSGRRAILSDTVGFVSDLPHELVEAFQATLEEVKEADILVHVRDAAHADSDAQKSDVEDVLAKLTPGPEDIKPPKIDVLNKADLLSAEARDQVVNRASRGNEGAILVSAQTGEGLAALAQRFDDILGRRRRTVELHIPWSDGAALTRVYERGEVVDRRDTDAYVALTVRLEPEDVERYARHMVETPPIRH